MRRFALTLIVVLAVAGVLAAQTPALDFDELMISQERRGGVNVILKITQNAFYIGEPAVSVPAEALTGAALRASRFAVRGWREGDHARIVVYALVIDSQVANKTLETAIATYAVQGANPIRVTETAEWGAAPIVLRPVRHLR
jgi:hypothetical protein